MVSQTSFFKKFNDGVFVSAKSVIVSSQFVAGDIQSYCAREGLNAPAIVVAPLGLLAGAMLATGRPLASPPTWSIRAVRQNRSSCEELPHAPRRMAQVVDEGVPQRTDSILYSSAGPAGWSMICYTRSGSLRFPKTDCIICKTLKTANCRRFMRLALLRCILRVMKVLACPSLKHLRRARPSISVECRFVAGGGEEFGDPTRAGLFFRLVRENPRMD